MVSEGKRKIQSLEGKNADVMADLGSMRKQCEVLKGDLDGSRARLRERCVVLLQGEVRCPSPGGRGVVSFS